MYALLRHRRRVPAVMTFHFACLLVVGERNGAVLALQRLAAGTTEYDRRIPPTIEQDHDLLLTVQALFDLLHQLARDDLLVTRLLELLPHVDDFDLRQWPLLNPVRHVDQRVLIPGGVEVRLQRWRRRSENYDGIRHLAPNHRHVARVIARRLFLLVGRVVLLVNDDEREISYRSKHR